MRIEIKMARRAGIQRRDAVPDAEWAEIIRRMREVFAEHDPETEYGETIKRLKRCLLPTHRFRVGKWRVGYCVDRIFLGKRVVIYRCDERDRFYGWLKRKGKRK